MALDINSVQRPFQKLRKILKGIGKSPRPEEVHALRTFFRRVEAVGLALQFERKRFARDLLKPFKPIQKVAGVVRDLDVLADLASSLHLEAAGREPAEAFDGLERRRAKEAVKLHKAVTARKKKVRKSLQRWSKQVEDLAHSSTTNLSDAQRLSATSLRVSLQLEAELRSWPELTAENLHSYRRKVRELRDVVQLTQSSSPKFVDALGDTKDRIGAWHDWSALAEVAESISQDGKERALYRKIQQRAEAEFAAALKVTNALQALYLNKGTARQKKRNGTPELNMPVIGAADARPN